MKIASILLTLALAGCATAPDIDTSVKPPVNTQINTQQASSAEIQTQVAVATTPAPTIPKNGPAQELFECKVKWKDGKKNRETEAFKVRIDYVKNIVESGSFTAKAPNVKADSKAIRFTAFNKHVSQIAVLTRSTGAFEAQFVNSKNKAKIDGQGNCKKLPVS